MKKILLILVLLCVVSSFAFTQIKLESFSEAPKELLIGVGELTPSFSLGPDASFLYLPISINIGNGLKNYLGFGVSTGYFFEFSESNNVYRLCALFDGRFTFGKRIAVDVDTGLGFIAAGGGAAFLGTAGVGLPITLSEKIKLRPYAAVDFAGNPNYDVLDYYDNQFIIWLHASVSVVIVL